MALWSVRSLGNLFSCVARAPGLWGRGGLGVCSAAVGSAGRAGGCFVAL